MLQPATAIAAADRRRFVDNLIGSRIPIRYSSALPRIDGQNATTADPSNFRTQEKIPCGSEPPSLRKEDRETVRKVKAQRKELNDNLQATVAHVNYLRRKVKETKSTIDEISAQLNSPQDDSCFAGECEDPTRDIFLAQESFQMQQDLLKNIDLEDKFTRELENAQRELWEAEVVNQSLSIDMQIFEPAITQYDQRNLFLTQKRATREKLMKNNAEKLRKQNISTFVNSIKESVEKHEKKSHVSLKVVAARNARKRIDHFIRKTMVARRQKKLMESCDEQLKQDRQQKLLAQLKQELDDQKDTLIAMSQAKQKKDAKNIEEKEKVRQELANSGKNPYYVEHLLAIEDRRARQQRNILDKEQERLTQLQRDFEITEKAKKREEIQRRKWSNFWAKKVEERKKTLYQKEAEFYDKETAAEPTETSPEILKDHYADLSTSAPPPSKASSWIDIVSTNPVKHSLAESRTSHTSDAKSIATKLPRKSHKVNRKSYYPTLEQSHEISKDPYVQEPIQIDQIKLSNGEDSDLMEEYEEMENITTESFWSEEYPGEFYEESGNGNSTTKMSIRHSSRKSVEIGVVGTTPEIAGGDAHAKPRVISHSKPGNIMQKKNKSKFYFRWKPDVITFSDYEVGKSYKKILTVTNVSTERSKFFLKSFIDRSTNSEAGEATNRVSKIPITDLVNVNFQVSKTLSPGLTHDIALTFTPSVLDDWKGLLKFETSNEPFEVVVECFKKRFVPVLSSVKAVFTNIVANTSATISIKLQNTGAKAGVITKIVQSNFGQSPPIDSEPSAAFSHPPSQVHVEILESQTHLQPVSSTTLSSQNVEVDPKASLHSNSDESKHDVKSLKKINSSSKKWLAKKSHVENKGQSFKIVQEILNELVNSISSNVFVAYAKEFKRSLKQNEVSTISLIFRPPCVDVFKATFEIYFDDPETEKLTFKAVGASMENPIHLDPLNTDFRICMMDHNYQQLVTVSTTIRGAGKVSPEVPKELRPYLEIFPKEVTVFSKNPGKFSIKFRPNPQMLQSDNPALKFIDTSSMIIDFPVYFNLKFPYKLSTPLTATFMGVLTNQVLEFSPRELNLGKCSSTETVEASFSIFNNSMLPQEIGFVEVPECISVQPNFGFATILPNEKQDFSIMLSLPENSKDNCVFILKCQTLQLREYLLPVRVFGKSSTIQLSQTRIFFPVTAVGSSSTTTIDIFSNAPETHQDAKGTKKQAKFEFYVAPNLPLTVLPSAGYIESKKPIKILIRFDAQVSEEEVRAHLGKILERDHIESQAMLQRELDGVDQTLKYEMLFNEEDFDLEFMRNLSSKNTRQETPSKRKSRKSERESLSEKGGTRSSFVQSAPTESNIRLSIESTKEDPPNELNRKENRRKSKAKGSDSSLNNLDSEGLKKKSVESDHFNPKRPSESKRKSKHLNRESEDSDDIPRAAPPNRKPTFMVLTHKVLEKRREELIKLLSLPYHPPKVENVEVRSKEFGKAKRDLIKHLETSSHVHTIPCFVTDESGESDVHLLVAKCPMSHPSLTLLEDSNTFDFGTVAIGSRAYREVHLYNVSNNGIKIKMDTINPYGPFSQCNALRKVPPDHVFTLKLKFQPEDIKTYEESVHFFGGDSRIIINLRGSAVEPNFHLKPTKSEFYLGTIQVGDFGFQELEITNSSSAELDFTVELLKQGCSEGTSKISHNPDTITTPTEVLEENPRRKSRKSYSKRKSVKFPTNPTERSNAKTGDIIKPTDPQFEIKDGDTKRNLNLQELLTFLEEKKTQYFFQALPSHIKVPAKGSKKFSALLVPAESGKYFAEFQVRLYQNVIHRFSVVGVGQAIEVSGGEAPEAE